MSVRVFAPAKINLTLKVGRPRADGRHPLQSVVMFADVGDWIEAAPADALTLAIDGPFAAGLSAGEDNLVLRAARVLDPRRGAAITLTKDLPIASGIGGGSSDAAATLKALRALWALDVSDDALADLARELGADVPVCVHARTALMRGAGEITTPFEAPPLACVLVNPLTPLSTAEVYRRFDAMDLGGGFTEETPAPWGNADEALASIAALGNDLEAPARALEPAIDQVRAALAADPRARHVALSGSGATVFALAATLEDAHALTRDLEQKQPSWWVRAATLGA